MALMEAQTGCKVSEIRMTEKQHLRLFEELGNIGRNDMFHGARLVIDNTLADYLPPRAAWLAGGESDQ